MLGISEINLQSVIELDVKIIPSIIEVIAVKLDDLRQSCMTTFTQKTSDNPTRFRNISS